MELIECDEHGITFGWGSRFTVSMTRREFDEVVKIVREADRKRILREYTETITVSKLNELEAVGHAIDKIKLLRSWYPQLSLLDAHTIIKSL